MSTDDVDRLKQRIRFGITSNSSFKIAGFENLSHDSGVIMKQLESMVKRSMPSQPKVTPSAAPEATTSTDCTTTQERGQPLLPSINEVLLKQDTSSSKEFIQNYIAGYESPISDSSFESTSGGNEFVKNIISNEGAGTSNTSNDVPIDNILVDLVEQVHHVKSEYKSIHQKMDDADAERKDLVKCLTKSISMLATNQNCSNTVQELLLEVRREMMQVRHDQQNTHAMMLDVIKTLSMLANQKIDPSNSPPCKTGNDTPGKPPSEFISI